MIRILNFNDYIWENFSYQYLTEALSNRSKRIFRNFFSSVIGDSNPLTESQIEELYIKYRRGILLFQNWVLEKYTGKYLIRFGADGKWGPETQKAWDDLSASYLSEKNPDKLPLKDFFCPDEKSFGDQKLKFIDWNEPKKGSDIKIPYRLIEGESSSGNLVFIGGLESNMKTEGQRDLLVRGLPNTITVKSFRYSDLANIKSYLQNNPGSIIICFSKGCEVAPYLINIKGVDPRKIFMIEPWHVNGANKGLRNLGIPEKNFFVGPSAGRGQGIVSNPSNSGGRGHFDALTTSARQIFSSGASQNTIYTSISESSPRSSFQNIIIGDSQSPYVDWGSQKFNLISDKGSLSALWLGGKGLTWLNSAVSNHPGSSEVKNIAICIGTNGIFNKNDNISGLVANIRNKFPNAKLFAIKGSWAWPGNKYNKDVTEKQVNDYYSIFSRNGVEVIEPAIGPIEPHGRMPIYQTIGKNLDNRVQ